MGVVYKMMAKVLVNKMKLVSSKVIFYSQNALYHWILNLTAIANECFNNRLRLGELGLLCKLAI